MREVNRHTCMQAKHPCIPNNKTIEIEPCSFTFNGHSILFLEATIFHEWVRQHREI